MSQINSKSKVTEEHLAYLNQFIHNKNGIISYNEMQNKLVN